MGLLYGVHGSKRCIGLVDGIGVVTELLMNVSTSNSSARFEMPLGTCALDASVAEE